MARAKVSNLKTTLNFQTYIKKTNSDFVYKHITQPTRSMNGSPGLPNCVSEKPCEK